MKAVSGLEAIRRAVMDCGVEVVTYVPGYPVTEVAKSLGAEISVNEKVALEIALGASATGNRSMVITKQVGMNILADPLLISVTHTIGSGLIILVGDDLGPKGSQAEMDSRYYGLICELPVLDPRDPSTLYDSIIEAFALSEKLKIPVIVRITSRLISSICHADLEYRVLAWSGLRFDPMAWDLTAKGKHQKHHYEILPMVEAASEASHLNCIQIVSNVGIISSGFPANFANELGVSWLAVGYAYPLPWSLIRNFIETHEIILIAEEPEPLIESQLRTNPKVKGRLTSNLPFGPLELSDLEKALRDEKVLFISRGCESAAERGYISICEGCPFESLYRALGKLNVPIAGDAGCVIKATRKPYSSVDLVYGLGSSVGVASGFKKKGVAVIGDFAFAHTGFPGLMNAIWQKRDVLVVLIQNGVAASTGGQEAPDLSTLLESLVSTTFLQLPLAEKEIERLLESELAKPGISAVIMKGKCVDFRR
jgi:indolepyruvate ferredoxin oxidoreductase alpha subunit